MSDSKRLILGLQYEEQLDPTVAAELNQILASISTWASQLGMGTGNLNINGMATFVGQPRVKLFKSVTQSIPDDFETVLTWRDTLTGSPLEEYDPSNLFDGSQYVVLKDPGLYLAVATVYWAANATGVRIVGIHPVIPAVDYFDSTRQQGFVSSTNGQQCVSLFPVINPVTPVAANPFPLRVGVQVYQNSGGALNVGGSVGNSRFAVYKIG